MKKNKWKLVSEERGQLTKQQVLELFDSTDYVVNSIADKETFEKRVNDDGTIMLYNTEWPGFKKCYGYKPKLVEDNNK